MTRKPIRNVNCLQNFPNNINENEKLFMQFRLSSDEPTYLQQSWTNARVF